MWRYTLYGLTLGSREALPGLQALNAAGSVDLRVRWPGEELPPPDVSWDEPGPTRSETAALHVSLGRRDGATFRLLRYSGAPGHIDFVVDPTITQLWVQWSERVSPGDVRSVLTGELMGCVLRLRGITCLHASAVTIDGEAVAVVGPKGAGKSTLAAAMAAGGHAVLTDDIVPLREADTGFTVAPGYARVRLRPDAARSLYGPIDALAPVWQVTDKSYVELSTEADAPTWRFQADTLPLRAVYVLAARRRESTSAVLQPLSPSEALALLPAHVYYTRAPMQRDQLARDFEALAHLARTTAIRTVESPDGLDRLPDVCHAIVRDAHAIAAA